MMCGSTGAVDVDVVVAVVVVVLAVVLVSELVVVLVLVSELVVEDVDDAVEVVVVEDVVAVPGVTSSLAAVAVPALELAKMPLLAERTANEYVPLAVTTDETSALCQVLALKGP
jgi:hypothetical protein